MFFSVKDRKPFHRVDTIGNIFTSGEKNPKYSVYFMGAAISKSSSVLFRYSPWCTPTYSNALKYYIKREKCKVNDVIFPSGCEAHAINLDNKNMKNGIFTGATSVKSKNIFTDISQFFLGSLQKKASGVS